MPVTNIGHRLIQSVTVPAQLFIGPALRWQMRCSGWCCSGLLPLQNLLSWKHYETGFPLERQQDQIDWQHPHDIQDTYQGGIKH